MDIDNFRPRARRSDETYSDGFCEEVNEFLDLLSIDPVTNRPTIKPAKKDRLAYFYSICIYNRIITDYPALLNDQLKEDITAIVGNNCTRDFSTIRLPIISHHLAVEYGNYYKAHNLHLYSADVSWIRRFTPFLFTDVPYSGRIVSEDEL